MRDKKGFTLIELLAVIVILAVIALIATPIIMNVINDSKEGAAKDAMYGYVKAVELASAKQISPTTEAPSGDNFVTKDGNIYEGSTKILDVTFKGTKPANEGTVKLSKGSVIEATLEFDGITVHYDGKKAEIGGSSTPTTAPETSIIGKEVYFDPTGAVTDCASGKEWTQSNTGTTCYKWNIIKENENSIEMLLNHNTTAHEAWSSSGTNNLGPNRAYNKLKTDTASWNKVETLTSSDNATRDNGSGGTYTINYDGMKGRFISGQEVANIVGNDGWTPNTSDSISGASIAWLYQNLSESNTTTQPYGYWTDTAMQSINSNTWVMIYSGSLTNSLIYNYDYYGIRPVVRVLKSNI